MSAAALQVSESPGPFGIASAAWPNVRKRLRVEVGDEAFDSWLRQLELAGAPGNRICLSVPTTFLKKWVEMHYLVRILAEWREEVPDVASVFLVVRTCTRAPAFVEAPTQTLPVTAPSPEPPEPSQETASPPFERDHAARLAGLLDPRLTFDTFVVGRTNMLAHAAAQCMTASPHYVHGPTGIGKTHLLQAIAAKLGRRALYVTSEKFCYTFSAAAHRYGSFVLGDALLAYDVVLFDDIQFITGRGMKLELARMVEHLLGERRHVVVAADRTPDDLHVDDRLRSRLAGGLLTEMGELDVDLRRRILHAQIERARATLPQFCLQPDVFEMIVANVTCGGRDLEGAINRLLLLARANPSIGLSAAEYAIRDLVRPHEPPPVKIDDIQRAVARHYGIDRSVMLSFRRTKEIVRPRQVGMYLAKQLTLRSLPEIGRRFGNRDHTTVLHAVHKIGRLITEDAALAAEIEALTSAITDRGTIPTNLSFEGTTPAVGTGGDSASERDLTA